MGVFWGADFNQQEMVFIPKNDALPRPPKASETRPLGLKDSAPKLLAATNTRRFNGVVSMMVSWVQRCFVGGRQFVLNLLDLDSTGRYMSLRDFWGGEAILALWDFAAAFPNIFHDWILAVFLGLGFPEGFCQFLEALLFHNFALHRAGGCEAFLFMILVGIIQGCPASGMVFAVASHPFFQMLASKQRALNLRVPCSMALRGCADDIGAALSSYKFLSILKPVFDKAQIFAGLRLKAGKCVIIPLSYADFGAKASQIQEWLDRHLQGWAGFQIKRTSKYLGVFVGPGALDQAWDAALDKYWKRVGSIAACGLSARFSVMAYNMYAVSVLSYLAQFSWLPARAIRLEQRAQARILHMPMFALGTFGPCCLQEVSLLNCRSLIGLNLASLFRAACITLKGWEKGWIRLVKASRDSSLDRAHRGLLGASCWESRPLALSLAAAKRCFRDVSDSEAPRHIVRFLNGWLVPLPPWQYNLPRDTLEPADRHKDEIWVQLQACLGSCKVQADAYKCIMKACLPGGLPDNLLPRIQAWTFKYFGIEGFNVRVVSDAIGILSRSSGHFASCAIKTWVNAWTTPCRLGNKEQVKAATCRFCRNGPEAFQHLVSCSVFFQGVWHMLRLELRSRRIRVPFQLEGNNVHVLEILGTLRPLPQLAPPPEQRSPQRPLPLSRLQPSKQPEQGPLLLQALLLTSASGSA